jgi:hypothetical protein
MATAAQPCSMCGTPVAPQNILYTQDARVVCARCYAQADIVETDKRAANNIRNAAIGCAIGGIFTFFSPLSGMVIIVLVAAALTIMSGVFAVMGVTSNQTRFTRHLTSGDRVLIWFCSIFGMLVGGFVALMHLVGFALIG